MRSHSLRPLIARDPVRGRLEQTYAPDEARPLAAYSASLALFATMVTGLVRLMQRRGGPPAALPTRDLVLASIAVFRASRLLATASVTSPLRAPFTTFSDSAGAGEVSEDVRDPDGGARHAIGELVSCPYCLGMWLATATGFGLSLAPAWTRVATSILAVDAGADVMQKLYSDLQAR